MMGTGVVDKLELLRPEMALFATACVTLVLGLSKSYFWRKSCAAVTAFGLVAAIFLSAASPRGGDRVVEFAVLPNLLPYVKTLVAAMGLLLLPVLMGTVDRDMERAIAKGGVFDPLRSTRGEFYTFFLLSLMGVMLCATADDLIWLFLALELTSLPTYIMVAMSSRRLRAQEAGVKYFFLGAFSAAIFLYGFAMLYGAYGTTSLHEIRALIAVSGLSSVATLGFMLAILGIAFKIAAAPMHYYTPDVYQGAASPVSAYLAFAPKAAGFVALLLLLSVIGWTHGPSGTALPEEIRVALWVMAAVTMTIGNTLALLQTSVKRMLAYSSIAHSGYMLVGLIAGPGDGKTASNGLAAMLFYLLCYGVMNLGAFAVLAALEKRSGDERHEVDSLADIRGLCVSHPLLGWSLVMCALSLLGMPPLLGFFGKLMLFTSAISAGEITLVVVLGLNSAIAAFYYLRIASAALLDERDEFADAPLLAPARGRRFAAALSAAGVVGLIALASPLQEASGRAAKVSSAMRLGATTGEAPIEAEAPLMPVDGRLREGDAVAVGALTERR